MEIILIFGLLFFIFVFPIFNAKYKTQKKIREASNAYFLKMYEAILNKTNLFLMKIFNTNDMVIINIRHIAIKAIQSDIPRLATFDIIRPYDIIPTITNNKCCNYKNDFDKYIIDIAIWYFLVMIEQPIFRLYNGSAPKDTTFFNISEQEKKDIDVQVDEIGMILIESLMQQSHIFSYDEIIFIITEIYNDRFPYVIENENKIDEYYKDLVSIKKEYGKDVHVSICCDAYKGPLFYQLKEAYTSTGKMTFNPFPTPTQLNRMSNKNYT